MSDSSPIAFRLSRGEKVRGLSGTVITTRSGIAEALSPLDEGDVKLARGDRIYLLTHVGEGFMMAWFKGRIFQAEALYPEKYKIIRQARSVWWVKVRNKRGKIGWSREPDNFGNKDQCG